MSTFVGFSTIGRSKKFTLTDFDLIKRDLSNALNIQQGQLPGRPGYGTTIWSYVFENVTPPTERAMIEEMRRVISLDPRIALASINAYPRDNGILFELEIRVVPSTTAQRLSLFFDSANQQASFV
jgi:phage baseplate assembly protein W